MATKAYSYLRFSTPRQATGDSLRRQLKAATDWAAEHPDIELDTTLRDMGVSAHKGENRLKGALASFLKKVQANEVAKGSYFLLESFDRFTRESESQGINMLTDLTLAGVKVVTLADGAVYDDKAEALDLFRAIIVMSRAHGENTSRTRKVAEAWAEKKEEARRTGKKVSKRGPAWTRWNDAIQDFELIPERALTVQRMFNLAADGLGSSAIAAILNDEGVATFGSNGWHPEYILKTLHAPSTIRLYQPNNTSKEPGQRMVRTPDGDPIPDYYPEVVSPDLFYRVQAVIDQRKKPHRAGRRGKTFPNIIIGLGKCEECGGTLIVSNRANSARVNALRCYAALRKHTCTNQRRYLCQPIEDDMAAFFVQAKLAERQETPDQSQLVAAIDQRAELTKTIEKLVDGFEKGIPGIENRLRQRNRELVALDAQIADLKKAIALASHRPANTGEAIAAIVSGLKSATGTDAYIWRAKFNAAICDRFDWVIPVEGGFYAREGTHGWIYERGKSLKGFRLADDVKPDRKVLDAIKPFVTFALKRRTLPLHGPV